MKNEVNRAFMAKKKKQYLSPISEIMNLRAMQAMMDSPLFGPASTPKNPFSAPKKKVEVF